MVTCIQELRAWPLRGAVIVMGIIFWLCALGFVAYFFGLFLGDLKLYEDRDYYMTVFPDQVSDLSVWEQLVGEMKRMFDRLCAKFLEDTTQTKMINTSFTGQVEIGPWWMWSIRNTDYEGFRRKKRMSTADSWLPHTVATRLATGAAAAAEIGLADTLLPGVSTHLQGRRRWSATAPIASVTPASLFLRGTSNVQEPPNGSKGAVGNESSTFNVTSLHETKAFPPHTSQSQGTTSIEVAVEAEVSASTRAQNDTNELASELGMADLNMANLNGTATPAIASPRRSMLLPTTFTDLSFDRVAVQSPRDTVQTPGFQLPQGYQQGQQYRKSRNDQTPGVYHWTFPTGRPSTFRAGITEPDATLYPGRPPPIMTRTTIVHYALWNYPDPETLYFTRIFHEWGYPIPIGPKDPFAFSAPMETDTQKSLRGKCLALEQDYLDRLLEFVKNMEREFVDSIQGRLHFVILVLDLVMVLLNSLLCIASYMLIVGAHTQNRVFLLPWICISGVCVYGNVIYILCHQAVVNGGEYFFGGIAAVHIILILILILLHVVALVMLHCFFKNLLYRDRRRGRH